MADALGLDDEDALLREVSLAGRRLAFVADETWRRVEAALVRRPRGRYRRVRREPLADGVGARATRWCWPRARRTARRSRAAAAGRGRRGAGGSAASPYTLKVLAVHSPPVPEPWPAEVRWSFLRLLASGRAAVPVLEQLDQEGLLDPADPRVGPRALAAAAAPVAPLHRRPAPGRGGGRRGGADPRRRPPRPAAGRRAPARHRQGLGGRPQRGRGSRIAAAIATRMGSPRRTSPRWPCSCATTCSCRRRPPGVTSTIPPPRPGRGRRAATPPAAAAARPGAGRRAATSASAWSPWKAHLVAALVARVQAKLGGGPVPEPEPVLHPTEPQEECTTGAAGAVTVGIADVADGQQVTIGAPDRPGLLSICAGVLALNQLDVRAAKMSVDDAYVTGVFAVRPASGARRCPRSWPTPCARRWRARCRWPSGCASGRPTTARTAPGRPRRGSPGTTARSAVRPRASSRCVPATGRGCSTGSPRRSRGRGSTSPRRGSRPSAPTRSTPSTCQPLGIARRSRAAPAGRRRAGGRHPRGAEPVGIDTPG